MVHALDEIRRTLKPGGILIDLRPVGDAWPVEISSSAGHIVAGHLTDMPRGVADDSAAFAAMADVESRGWFIRETEDVFAFFYYWDTPSGMKEWIEEEWKDFIEMGEDIYRKTKALWASANADARVRVRVKMTIARWRKS